MGNNCDDTMKPNPGSEEAVEQGCLCARLDNNFGAGAYHSMGGALFWIDAGCPLHGAPDE